jgi:hypothetical protein
LPLHRLRFGATITLSIFPSFLAIQIRDLYTGTRRKISLYIHLLVGAKIRSRLKNNGLNVFQLLAVAVVIFPAIAKAGFILVSSPDTIGEYTTSGASVNPSLITGIITQGAADPFSFAISGSDIYVPNWNNGTNGGTLGEYTISGALINRDLITDLSGPWGPVFSGADLFILNGKSHSIGEYTTQGSSVNVALLPSVLGPYNPDGIAISGSDIFCTGDGNPGALGEYTTAGVTINDTLITGLNHPVGVVVSGSHLFVANDGTGNSPGGASIGEYTTSGAVVNPSLISGLSELQGIAIDGSDLYVTSETGIVGEYTTSGATVNADLISGLNDPSGIVVVDSIPEPTSVFILVACCVATTLRNHSE